MIEKYFDKQELLSKHVYNSGGGYELLHHDLQKLVVRFYLNFDEIWKVNNFLLFDKTYATWRPFQHPERLPDIAGDL